MMCRWLSSRRPLNLRPFVFRLDSRNTAVRVSYFDDQYQNTVSFSAADLLDLKGVDPLNGAYVHSEVTAQWSRDMLADYSYAALITELPVENISMKT